MWWRLDRRRAGAAAGLDDVGVQRALDEELRVAELDRLLLEDADELGADDLALGLGLADAGELVQEAVLGVDGHERDPCSCSRKAVMTWSPSFLRIRPWSTKMHVSWSPIAWWTSTAATDESTPPERPQMTFASPTCARMRAICSSTIDAADQVMSQPQTSPRKRLSTSWPVGRVDDLGVELDAVESALDRLEAPRPATPSTTPAR